MEISNVVKLQSKVIEFDEVFRGDKGALYALRLVGWASADKEGYCMVKADEKLVKQEGFGVGAWVQISGKLTAREGKDGRWWGEVTAQKLVVAVPAPVKTEEEKPAAFEDDDIPF